MALYMYHNDEDYFIECCVEREAERLGIPVYYEDISGDRTQCHFVKVLLFEKS